MPESLLIRVDVGLPGAALRVALGAALALLLAAAAPGAGPLATALALLALLFGVKVFAAVARRLVRPSPAVLAHWEWRRNLARFHDSYQWKKLLWFGAGLLLGSLASSPLPGPRAVGAACLLAGAIGHLLWWRKRLSVGPPARA